MMKNNKNVVTRIIILALLLVLIFSNQFSPLPASTKQMIAYLKAKCFPFFRSLFTTLINQPKVVILIGLLLFIFLIKSIFELLFDKFTAKDFIYIFIICTLIMKIVF